MTSHAAQAAQAAQAGTAPPLASPPARPRRLPAAVAFYLLASIIVSFLAGSSAPTPLYAVYQAAWGFSPITTTVVFGVYALAVLAALLTAGSLSDYVGRRPVLLVTIALQAIVMLAFATAGGVPQLLAARVVQGLATGAAAGAIGAGLLDLDKTKGALANAVGPVTGTAAGALGSGLFVQYLPDPTRLVYLALFAIFILQGAGITLMSELAAPRPGALASLRPRFALPPDARRPLLVAAPVLVAVWSLAGFYGSLGPALVRLVAGSASLALGGLALSVLAGSGALTVLLLRRAAPRMALHAGAAALLLGVGVTLLAITRGAAGLFFVGTAVAGVGFGGGFQGALRTVLPRVAPHERAGVLSIIYVVSYLAFGLPAVIAGFLVAHGGGVLTTAREYGLAVMALALLALLGLARRHKGRTPGQRADAPLPIGAQQLTAAGPRPLSQPRGCARPLHGAPCAATRTPSAGAAPDAPC